ncbi:MAG: iron-sulfur cluster assembly scaffold protein [Pseudomonadota bacterium]
MSMQSKMETLLKVHSRHYLEMALSRDKQERIDDPDAYGKRTGDCGDTVEFFLSIRDDRINRTLFDADGCMNTFACANTVSALSEGKTISEAWEIKAEDIIEFLETLPPDEHHCAELAIGAFYLALRNYGEFKRSPWKKAYRNTPR